jgi:hypothetical protein
VKRGLNDELDYGYRRLDDLPGSEKSRRSGAWYRFWKMAEMWKGGISTGVVMSSKGRQGVVCMCMGCGNNRSV